MTKRGGIKKSQNVEDIIYGCPQEGPNSRFIDNREIPGIVPGERLASVWRALRRLDAARQSARQGARHARQANQNLPENDNSQKIGHQTYLLLVLYQYTLDAPYGTDSVRSSFGEAKICTPRRALKIYC